MLNQAAEEARRRVISLYTHGGGSSERGDRKASLSGAAGISPDGGGDSGTGLACVVEMQESEIATLRQELSEALSRVPRGGGEGGGVSALEAALKKQVDTVLCQSSRESAPLSTWF